MDPTTCERCGAAVGDDVADVPWIPASLCPACAEALGVGESMPDRLRRTIEARRAEGKPTEHYEAVLRGLDGNTD